MPRQRGSSTNLIRINGERIQEIRVNDLDISQKELAKRARVSSGYISLIEAGKKPALSRMLFERVAGGLGVPGEEIRAGDLAAVSGRTEILRFSGVGLNDATATELAREIQQANAYIGRITKALRGKLR